MTNELKDEKLAYLKERKNFENFLKQLIATANYVKVFGFLYPQPYHNYVSYIYYNLFILALTDELKVEREAYLNKRRMFLGKIISQATSLLNKEDC